MTSLQSIEKKHLQELSIHELSYIHTSQHYSRIRTQDCFLHSSLYDLIECTSACLNNRRTKTYASLFTMLAILDMLGNEYAFVTREVDKKKSGIIKALVEYGNLSISDSEIIYSLRNGCIHAGSLVNTPINKKNPATIFRIEPYSSKDRHELEYNDEGKPIIIIHSQLPWDGIYRDDLKKYTTKLKLNSLFNLIKKIVEKINIKTLEEKNFLPYTEDAREFFYKYLFKIQLQPHSTTGKEKLSLI